MANAPDSNAASAADVADVDALLDRLRDAAAALDDARQAVADVGEAQVEAVADAHRRAMALLNRYEDRATGSGSDEFRAYLEFQEEFASLVDGFDEDLPAHDAFEAANETFQKRRLTESDFATAREQLAPAGEIAGRLDHRESARETYREVRREAERRRETLADRVEDLARLERLAEADLDAPVERLRDPVEAYDAAVREAFERFRGEAAAREVLAFVDATRAYPLVDFETPPDDLREYVRSASAGAKPIPKLLEYADQTRSKLEHYVDDPAELKTRVAVHRTYLDRLGPEPLTVGWPVPPADHLRYLSGELVSVVARFADDSVVARARRLRALADREDFERLRNAAVARADLSEAERRRVASGRVADDLAAAREALDRLSAALDEHGPE